MTRLLAMGLLAGLFACDKDEYVPEEDPIDIDGDGYAEEDDCDDLVATVNPGAVEVCDEIDNNCNGEIDEGAGRTYYLDGDGDGYGLTDQSVGGCEPPEGYAADDGDCDDAEPLANPGNLTDGCDDIDNDCDDNVDEDAVFGTYYGDSDGDGYGLATDTLTACQETSGYVADPTDCDDTNANSYPGAPERCDDEDNNCNSSVDDDVVEIWYRDNDADDFGNPNNSLGDCNPPAGYVPDDSDCDDTLDTVNPQAPELCDTIDNNCEGSVDEDYCYEEWTGDRHMQWGIWNVPTQRDCELYWNIDAERIGYTVEECVDCVFAFDIEYTYDTSRSYDNGVCETNGQPVGLDFSYQWAYNPSYGPYGPVWYAQIYGPDYGWYPAYLSAPIKKDIYIYEGGVQDMPIDGGYYYTNHIYELINLK